MDTNFLVRIEQLFTICADINNGTRIRFSSLRRWKKRIRTLCQQFQLSKRFLDPQGKYVVYDAIWISLKLTLRLIVNISSLLVEEIKRIIKTSEIMK